MCEKFKHPATRNRTRDHLIAASDYSQMLYQLSYSRHADFTSHTIGKACSLITAHFHVINNMKAL